MCLSRPLNMFLYQFRMCAKVGAKLMVLLDMYLKCTCIWKYIRSKFFSDDRHTYSETFQNWPMKWFIERRCSNLGYKNQIEELTIGKMTWLALSVNSLNKRENASGAQLEFWTSYFRFEEETDLKANVEEEYTIKFFSEADGSLWEILQSTRERHKGATKLTEF